MKRLGGRFMLIASPLQYNEIMEEIPEGKGHNSGPYSQVSYPKAGADVTCPLTAGIFINICANASEEREDNKIPYWRTLKTEGTESKVSSGSGRSEETIRIRGSYYC